MFLTSGTTGRPKAVVQTQRNQMTALTTMFAHYGLRFGAEVCLNTMPMFNNYGATGIMNVCVFGGETMVSTKRWDPAVALELITEHSITTIWGTPTIYVDLCEKFDASRHAVTSVRRAITAGAPTPEPLIERFRALTGVRLAQAYGATETTGAVAAGPFVGRARPGSLGQLVGGVEVTIVDAEGSPLPAGSVGEIRIAGDVVSPGYLNDPESQAAAFSESGWASGDLGYLDEDGFLFLVGRQKEMIISGGNNIYPAEVESLLAQHDAVATCVVLGLPDPRRGEVPVAVIIPRAGSGHVTEWEIVEFCSQRMATYKVPRAVQFTDTLPLGPTGKVLRAELRASLASPQAALPHDAAGAADAETDR
jgi:long-chain acyl-CoA synthetase